MPYNQALISQISGGFDIHFHSDSEYTMRGFKMSFERFQPTNEDEMSSFKPCPDILRSTKHYFQTLPELGRYFPINGICVFKVVSQITFIELLIEYVGKHVKIDVYYQNEYTRYNSSTITLYVFHLV